MPSPTSNTKQKVVNSSTDLIIAIYPGYFSEKMQNIGFSCGWYNKNTNYCLEWGNHKTREEANDVLRAAYPNAEIINFDTVPVTRNHKTNTIPMVKTQD